MIIPEDTILVNCTGIHVRININNMNFFKLYSSIDNKYDYILKIIITL